MKRYKHELINGGYIMESIRDIIGLKQSNEEWFFISRELIS